MRVAKNAGIRRAAAEKAFPVYVRSCHTVADKKTKGANKNAVFIRPL